MKPEIVLEVTQGISASESVNAIRNLEKKGFKVSALKGPAFIDQHGNICCAGLPGWMFDVLIVYPVSLSGVDQQ